MYRHPNHAARNEGSKLLPLHYFSWRLALYIVPHTLDGLRSKEIMNSCFKILLGLRDMRNDFRPFLQNQTSR